MTKESPVEEQMVYSQMILNAGFIITKVEENKKGEYRFTILEPYIWKTRVITIKNDRVSIIEEFCNEYEEVHALGIGIFHTFTKLKPLKYSEIEENGLSPALAQDLRDEYHYYLTSFWSIRIIIAVVVLYYTGIPEMALSILGW